MRCLLTGRLGAQIVQADAARFAGREHEIALLESILDDQSRVSVVFVHGPGGIGKSTLLRAVGRLGAATGYEVFAVDGRELAPSPGDLERALDGADRAIRPLVLFDTYERVAALDPHLRHHLLPQLPDTARVVIAGRSAPSEGWRQHGWDAVTLPVALSPLSDDDALALLARRGLTDPVASAEVVTWADGSPLALALAADGIAVSGRPAGLSDDRELDGELVRRLVGEEFDGADLDVLAVTALAHHVDARLLADVLPSVDGDHAVTWLRSLSFAETISGGVTLHDRVRRSLRADLAETDPARHAELRRRIADHLYARGRAGDTGRFLEFGELVTHPAVQWGFGIGANRTHGADIVREGDLETAARALGADGEAWWDGIARWFEDAPQDVVTFRDAEGALAGFSITTTPASAPPWSAEDEQLAPVVAHALERDDPHALIRRDAYDLTAGRTGAASSPTTALMSAAFALRGDLAAARRQYCINDALDTSALAFNRAAGLDHLAELDRSIGGRALHYHLLDHGPGGVMNTGRGLVYREIGMTPAASAPTLVADIATIRDALRAFHDPLVLAASPLAVGADVPTRVASVRERLRTAIDAEFGVSAADQLLRAVLLRGHLDPDGGHEIAILELNVSRATYFRRLTAAVARIAPRVGTV